MAKRRTVELPRLLAIHDTFERSGAEEIAQWLLDNVLLVAAFFVALVAIGLLIHLIPTERGFVRLLERVDRWWSSPDTTKPDEIDRIHEEEELKHVGRRGPTV